MKSGLPRVAPQLARFCVVGGLGFVVDAIVLHALVHAGASPYAGRVASFLVAATVTWSLNRAFTFRAATEGPLRSEWGRYVAVNAVGGTLNYATYAIAIATLEPVRAFPVLGVALGSVAALAVNFEASRRVVFRSARLDRRSSIHERRMSRSPSAAGPRSKTPTSSASYPASRTAV